jgi:hypothetical protein
MRNYKDRRSIDLSKWLDKYRDELMKKDNEYRRRVKNEGTH